GGRRGVAGPGARRYRCRCCAGARPLGPVLDHGRCLYFLLMMPILSHSQCRAARGFTLIELVLTMVLLGVLAVSFWPRAPTQQSMTLAARANQLASDIRYVQTLSMTRGVRFCIVMTASTYSLRTTD